MVRRNVPKGIFCRILCATRWWEILEALSYRRATTSRCGDTSLRRNCVSRLRYLSRSDIQNQSYGYPRKTPSPLNKAHKRRSFIQCSSLWYTYIYSITYYHDTHIRSKSEKNELKMKVFQAICRVVGKAIKTGSHMQRRVE